MVPHEDIKAVTLEVPSIQEYKQAFAASFDGFYKSLYDSLIEDILDVNARGKRMRCVKRFLIAFQGSYSWTNIKPTKSYRKIGTS